LREETHKAKEDAPELACRKVIAEQVTTDAEAAAKAEVARAEEAIAKEAAAKKVATSCASADEVVVEEAIAAIAPSGQAGQGEPHEAAEEAMEETPAGAGTQERQEVAAQASSDTAPVLGAGTDTLAPKKKVDEVADPPHAGADAGPGNVSRETSAARTEEVVRGEVSVTPGAAAKSVLGGRTFMAPTGSSAGTQSSASWHQKEWADMASSAGSSEASEARAGTLTLADLSKLLTAVRESLRNASLQFVEAEKTVDVSNLFLASHAFAG
jgi:hypothetical protein